MRPILYESTETAFTTQGLGALECLSATVEEELNGPYEMEFEMSKDCRHFKDVKEGRIVLATHDNMQEPEPFVIYKSTANIDGVVKYNARHISYRLNNMILRPFSAASLQASLTGLNSYAINPQGFTFGTNFAKNGNFAITVPTACRSAMGGIEGSILDIFGGEWEFKKFHANLWAHRGATTNITISYGKNLLDIDNENDSGDYYNAVVPYWYQEGQGLVTVSGYVVRRPFIPIGEPIRAMPLDLTQDFPNQPTAADLETEALKRLDSGKPWLPKQNIKVDFIQLYQTAGYEDRWPLQRLNLGDEVIVSYPGIGVEADYQKIIKTTYNVLTERYDKIELGQRKPTLSDVIMRGPIGHAINRAYT